MLKYGSSLSLLVAAAVAQTPRLGVTFEWSGDLIVYPGYAGALTAQVQALTVEFNDIEVAGGFTMAGTVSADPTCDGTADASASNSCGVHVHAGADCDHSGGHLYATASDPWATVIYNNSVAFTGLNVDTGVAITDVLGMSNVVVHDRAGARIGCFPLNFLTSANPRAQTRAIEFQGMQYGEYPPQVPEVAFMPVAAARISIGPSTILAANAVLSYVNLMADSECESIGVDTVGNSCGVHIHAGTSCKTAADVGGHFWLKADQSSDADPWKTIAYTTPTGSSGEVSMSDGSFGITDVHHRALVVHNRAGKRVSCQLLTPPAPVLLTAGAFATYPGYTGDITVSGMVSAYVYTDAWVAITTKDLMADATCTDTFTCSTDNCCGVHVHEGTCSAAGNHYWSNAGAGADEWLSARYTLDGDGKSSETIDVQFGYALKEGYGGMFGRSIVVHDAGGARIACAPLDGISASFVEVSVHSEPMAEYPESVSPDAVSVVTTVSQADSGTHANIDWFIVNSEGGDPNCANGADQTASNSCGFHLHFGDCPNFEADGHYYNADVDDIVDPFARATYTTVSGRMTVDLGYTAAEFLNAATPTPVSIVVHDYAGARIACAPLGDFVEVDSASALSLGLTAAAVLALAF